MFDLKNKRKPTNLPKNEQRIISLSSKKKKKKIEKKNKLNKFKK